MTRLISHADRRLAAVLNGGQASAIGKIGGTEGGALKSSSWWVRAFRPSRFRRKVYRLYERSGVFPCNPTTFLKFTRFYGEQVLPQADVLFRWRGADDDRAKRRYKLRAEWLETKELAQDMPWLDGLSDRRFVVVTSFTNTVQKQLGKLSAVWGRSEFSLSERNVRIVACPHYAHLVPPQDRDWFEALDRLAADMNREAYDIALIGAGAWSLPLAVRAKQAGRIGIHMGGQLQRIFGIAGSRWEGKEAHMNEHWTRVLPTDTPAALSKSTQGFKNDCAYW